MVETKDSEKPTLPSKRKPDLSCEENESHHSKTQKLQTLNNNSEISEGKILERDKECLNLDAQANGNDDEDEEEEDDDDDDVEGNGEAVVDRKGKGILIEEEDDESDDEDGDSSDGGSDGDSELSDDPLAEVDLENILPSRTRRKVIQPGEYIANDLGDEDDDSDSEDEDA
ncbi:histone H2A.Z-specific chaperone CHZ1-like [Mangifera indica]|uniref:histone H2A.Z-specific chaperone CHZ1-like n=1 Tax=Mangifera indica TaxID=29780 RepID=UPI001CFBAAA3|nr:histone H2A.Z-specific chaperone CHZ1-like [Mangifera indica]XP_044502455.1 histone H2A.Z-specific chaperone CHZ1-like [Mangifera indica]XP_044502456.1 histone H2A.Z-specific chaperone CHZ1-like [Mangifera indica]